MSRVPKPVNQRKKIGWKTACGLPFPNFALGKTEIPAVCRCVFDGTNFFVTNPLDMHTLHYNGSFGTSSLTFRGLSYNDNSFMKRAYYKKICRTKSELAAGNLNNGISSGANGSLKFINAGKSKRIRVDVEPSKSSPNLRVHISNESSTYEPQGNSNDKMNIDEENSNKNETRRSSEGPRCDPQVPKIDTQTVNEERLILMPEEAIFLSFGVGCLAIYNIHGQAVDYKQCWKKLVTVNPSFPAQYAAYHYFRSKNWVPKKGNNYGASYVLYESGPSFSHATYIVHIVESTKPRPTWMEMATWQRLATHVSKHVLLCEVSVPKTFRPEISEPRSVFDMKLEELSLFRWLPKRDTQN